MHGISDHVTILVGWLHSTRFQCSVQMATVLFCACWYKPVVSYDRNFHEYFMPNSVWDVAAITSLHCKRVIVGNIYCQLVTLVTIGVNQTECRSKSVVVYVYKYYSDHRLSCCIQLYHRYNCQLIPNPVIQSCITDIFRFIDVWVYVYMWICFGWHFLMHLSR